MSSARLLREEHARQPSVCERCCDWMGGRRNDQAPDAPGRVELESRVQEKRSTPPQGTVRSNRRSTARSSTAVVDVSMCDLPSILPEDLTARQALQKLRDGLKAFEVLSETLPRGADEAVKGLRTRIDELQLLVERADNWERRFPSGGQLMWVQMSPAAGDEDPPEWSIGQLYVAKDCLVFEANESPPWTAGPIMWDKIVKVEMLHGTNSSAEALSPGTPCDIRLHYKGGPFGPDSIASLRVQLSIVDMAWLERALPSETQVEAVKSDKMRGESNETEVKEPSAKELEESVDVMAKGSIGGSICGSICARTMVNVANDMDVTGVLAGGKEPIFTSVLPEASLEDIRQSIVKQGWLDSFLTEKLNAFEITSTPWGTSRRLPGSFISRTTWQMPFPVDLPEDMPRLQFPENLSVMFTARILATDSEVLISQRGSCRNLQYVDQAVVETFMMFRFQDDCSIALSVFTDVNWPQELPESYASLKGLIEMTTRNCSTDFGKMFAQRFNGTDMTVTAETMAKIKTLKPAELQPLMLSQESLHLTGIFAKWKTDFAGGKLYPMPQRRPGFALMKMCVRMTSESFSFAVVSGRRGWDWRLYPRDAVPIKIGFIKSHVSKEGMLTKGQPDAVIVGLGNLSIGHGLNFHVLEKEGAVVTIWVEVPASQEGNELSLRTDTAEGTYVWYTKEDTGVNHHGGDNMDLSKYKRWLPPREED